MTGLLIELVGVWAIFSGRGDKDATRISLPGGRSAPIAWLVVGLGFVLWLTGGVLVSLSRPPRRKRGRIDDQVAWSGHVGDDLAKPAPADDEVETPGRIDEVGP